MTDPNAVLVKLGVSVFHVLNFQLILIRCLSTGPGSLRVLYEEDWAPTTKRNFVKYWYDTVEDKEVREVIGPEPLKPKGNDLEVVNRLGA